MNKLIILLLVVCLVSVHAFVKRDAPAPQQQDIVGDAKKFLENGLKEIQEKFNPDTIKKAFGDTLDTINKALTDLKPTEAPKA